MLMCEGNYMIYKRCLVFCNSIGPSGNARQSIISTAFRSNDPPSRSKHHTTHTHARQQREKKTQPELEFRHHRTQSPFQKNSISVLPIGFKDPIFNSPVRKHTHCTNWHISISQNVFGKTRKTAYSWGSPDTR